MSVPLTPTHLLRSAEICQLHVLLDSLVVVLVLALAPTSASLLNGSLFASGLAIFPSLSDLIGGLDIASASYRCGKCLGLLLFLLGCKRRG